MRYRAYFAPLENALGVVSFCITLEGGKIVDVKDMEIGLDAGFFGRREGENIEELIEEYRRRREWKKLEVVYHEYYHVLTLERMLKGKYVWEVDRRLVEGSAYLYGKLRKYADMTGNEELAYYLAVKELERERNFGKERGYWKFVSVYVEPALKIARTLKPKIAIEMLENVVPEYGSLEELGYYSSLEHAS